MSASGRRVREARTEDAGAIGDAWIRSWQAAYEAAGWNADGGAKTEATSGATLDEVRYRRDLRSGTGTS